jgi:PAS domain S-box-containing protein
MQQLFSKNRINILFLIFLLFVIIYLAFIYLNISYSQKQAKIYEQSINKVNVLHDILFDVKNMESTQRGYMLTKQPSFLKSYYNNVKDLNQKMKQANRVFEAEELKTIQFDSIALTIQSRIQSADSTIDYFKNLSKDSAVAFVIGDRGLLLMEFVQQKIEKASHHYMAEAQKFSDINKTQIKYRLFYFNLIVVFFILVIIFNIRLIKRDLVLQEEKVQMMKQFASELEDQVKQKTKELNQANEELKFFNDRFLLIAEASNEALWDWDLKTNIIWGNDYYLKTLGKSENDENNFNDFTSRIHPDDMQSMTAEFQKSINSKTRHTYSEFRFKNTEGDWSYLINRSIVLYDEKNNPYRSLGSFEDITLSHQVQKEIQKQKDISTTLIESLPGIFFMFDSNKKFIRWNKNLTNITGYLPEDMEYLTPLSFLADEQVEMVVSKIASVFEKGIDYVEADLLTKDKKRIPYFFTGVRVRINDDDCLMGVGIDISERVGYQEQLKALALYLQQIREEERTIISREIHDELGQQLTALKMNLSMLKRKVGPIDDDSSQKINDAISITNDAMIAVRRISAQLRPSILDDLGLQAAMEWQSEEFEKRYGIRTEFISNQNNLDVLSIEIKTGIFRIYQESLTNVLKHAQASKVDASLHLDNNIITLAISDNGIGFDEAEIEKKKTFGMLGIKERTSLLKGNCLFLGKPGLGTTVLVKIPISV